MFSRRKGRTVPLTEHAAAVGFVVGYGDHETGDAVGVAVEGDDFDESGGVFAVGEVGGVFWGWC